MGWFWVGGCLLGLVMLEIFQRQVFPGESPPFLGRWRRTRRRESAGGGGSVSRTAPHGAGPLLKILPQLPELTRQLAENDPEWVERRIRRVLSGCNEVSAKTVLTCLLAEASLKQEDRSEAHRLVDEAQRHLSVSRGTDQSGYRAAAIWVFQFRVLLALQEGRCSEVLSILSDAERRFGPVDWMILNRAETFLLGGNEELARGELESLFQGEFTSRRRRLGPTQTSAILLLSECYLQRGRMKDLLMALGRVGPRSRLVEEDQAAFARLHLEAMLYFRNISAAWRQAGILARLCEAHPLHRGLSRTFHLACSRIHFVEGDMVETYRRLQFAENEADYPVALWEVKFHLGMVLEAENRTSEAEEIWEVLSEKASQTRFGRLATSYRLSLRTAQTRARNELNSAMTVPSA